MKRTAIITAAMLIMCGTCLAQDSAPPVIEDVEWQISRYMGGDNFLDFYDAYVAFDPSLEIAHEKDLIVLIVTVSDSDFTGEEGEGLFYLVQTDWVPVNGYTSPEPPPVAADLTKFFPDENGLKPGAGDTLTFFHFFEVPSFVGQNQARLRGLIDYDVRWLVRIIAANDNDPGCTDYIGYTLDLPCESAVDWWSEFFYAKENPVLGAPNPPPFADAGPDQAIEAGSVTLDGSRSIDLYNIGFNTDSGNIVDKDSLTFIWEWISGPQKVDPVQTDVHEPTVTIDLVLPGTYVYRLTVDDNVNALPSTDTVTVVVTTLEENLPPKARIAADPVGKTTWVVGETIKLSGATSSDLNTDDVLEYTWRQTDELGGVIPSDSLRQVFQPLSGLTSEEAEWQALVAGEYYFRLLVSDGEFTDTDTFTVNIIESAAAGATVGGEQEDAQLLGPLGATGACGAGVMPFALVPLAYCAMRRRYI